MAITTQSAKRFSGRKPEERERLRQELGRAWLSLAAARDELGGACPTDSDLEALIASNLKNGFLRLFAAKLEPSDEEGWSPDPAAAATANFISNLFEVPGRAHLVTDSFFNACTDLTGDLRAGDWIDGEFLFNLTMPTKQGKLRAQQWAMRGPLIAAAELEGLKKLIRAGTVGPKPKGGRPRKRDWGYWVSALVLKVVDQGFDPNASDGDLDELSKLVDQDSAMLGGDKIDPRDRRMVLQTLREVWKASPEKPQKS